MTVTDEIIEAVHHGGAQQHMPELRFMVGILDTIRPKKILEIGTGVGVFTYLLSLYGDVVSVDVQDSPGLGYGPLADRFGIWGNVEIVQRRNSQDPMTAAQVKGEYGLVVIDADHSWEGGFKDWQLYGGMAPAVAVHDIVEYEKRYGMGHDKRHADWFPTEFWHYVKTGETDRPIKIDYPFTTKEFVDVLSGGWGVLFKT